MTTQAQSMTDQEMAQELWSKLLACVDTTYGGDFVIDDAEAQALLLPLVQDARSWRAMTAAPELP